MRTLLLLVVTGCSTLMPVLAAAAPLPKDGGEPGQAYRDCLSAIGKQEKPAIIAQCFAPDDAWLAKTNIDYFTPETFALEVRQLSRAFAMVDVKISGGNVDGDTAELLVSGKRRVERLEPTGEIVESGREPVKGKVFLRRSASGWRHTGDELTITLE
jgi:hypothetical protein